MTEWSVGRPSRPAEPVGWLPGAFKLLPEPTHSIASVAIPERARADLERRLDAHRRARWPQLRRAGVRFRAPFAYVEATLPDGYDQPLFRLRWTGNQQNKWAFAIWLASKDGYEPSVLPSGMRVGTVEEAMDCACGLYLNDPSAWVLPRQRSAPRH